MRKLKVALFASSILGMLAVSSYTAADTEGNQVTISHYNEQAGTFDVNAVQAANGKTIQSIDVAIWSEENGQDDLKWYHASNDGSNQLTVHFNAENHGSKVGSYIAHAYITYTDGNRVGVNLGKRKLSLSAPQLSLKQGGLQLFSKLKPGAADQLFSAVWSAENGQDDLHWYTADADGNTLAGYANHKGYGTYHVHTYLKQNGKMIPISAQDIDIPKPKVKIQIDKINDTSYDVVVNNVPPYISSVAIPVWSEQNGQDDLKWYQATKVADGIFKTTVYLKAHRFELGNYQAHIYGDSQLSKKLDGLGETHFNVPSIINYEDPQVTIDHYNINKGTFDVTVAETVNSKAIQSISAAVWSDANQANLYWYEAKQLANGKAAITADVQKHGNQTGSYNVHVYVHYNDGTTSGHVLANQQLNQIVYYQPSAVRITAYMNEKNTYPVGQCTWGVKELAPWIPNWLGNGGQWASTAAVKGFKIGTVPKVGAIACWSDGGYGHVAYVTHVESNNRIQVKEANYKNQQYISNFRGWFDPTAPYLGRLTYIYPD